MKVGIVTMRPGLNYGGILQAYALQKALEKYDLEVCHIFRNNDPNRISFSQRTYRIFKRIIKNLIGIKTPLLFEKVISDLLPIATKNTSKFIDNYFNYKIYDNYNQVKEGEYDVIVAGSDQIWRPLYFGDNIENAYLQFTDSWNIKRIAYAASFGTDQWEYSDKARINCQRLLQKFDAVSVREESGIFLCKKYFDIKAELVLDPTMLLDEADYVKLFSVANTEKSQGNLLYYILDETEEKMSLINKVASQYDLVPFKVNAKHLRDFTATQEEKILPPVEQWIRSFYDSEFVITDSFHGCVFSILFHKPFIALGNRKRGMSRFDSLLKITGLEDRLLHNIGDYKQLGEINYDMVDNMLASWKKKSKDFLVNAIL